MLFFLIMFSSIETSVSHASSLNVPRNADHLSPSANSPHLSFSASNQTLPVIVNYTVFRMDPLKLKSTIDAGIPIEVPLWSGNVSVYLQRNGVVPDGTLAAVSQGDGSQTIAQAMVWTYNGVVIGQNGSAVTLTLGPAYAGGRMNYGINHLIIQTLNLYTHAASDNGTIMVYPADGLLVSAPPSLIDPLDPPSNLSVQTYSPIDLSLAQRADQSSLLSTMSTGSPLLTDYIRLEGDFEYYYYWGGDAWYQHMATVINDLNVVFNNQLSVAMSVVLFEIQFYYFTQNCIYKLLDEFQQYMNAYTYKWPFDHALLFSGKSPCDYPGVAFEPALDSTEISYAVILSVDRYTSGGLSLEEYTAGHELGHNFNGDHCSGITWTDTNGKVHASMMFAGTSVQGTTNYRDMWYSDGSRQGYNPKECGGTLGYYSNVARMVPYAQAQLPKPIVVTFPDYRLPTASVISYSPSGSWVNPNSILGLADQQRAYVPWNADGGCAHGDVITLDIGQSMPTGRVFLWYYGYGGGQFKVEVSPDLSTWSQIGIIGPLPVGGSATASTLNAGATSTPFRYVRITIVSTYCNTQEFDSIQVIRYYPVTVTSYSPTSHWVNPFDIIGPENTGVPDNSGIYTYISWNADGRGCNGGEQIVVDMGYGAAQYVEGWIERKITGGTIYFWWRGYADTLNFEVSNDLNAWTYVGQVSIPFGNLRSLYLQAGSTTATFRYIRVTNVNSGCNTVFLDSVRVV